MVISVCFGCYFVIAYKIVKNEFNVFVNEKSWWFFAPGHSF